jgi:hypothetical protein
MDKKFKIKPAKREIRIVADAGEPPVIIPVIVVAVDIHVALVVVPAVEGEQYYAKRRLCHCPLNTLGAVSNFVS